MDNRGGNADSVAAGTGEQSHNGRIYPYFARDRNCSGVDTSHSGEKNRIVAGDVRYGQRA